MAHMDFPGPHRVGKYGVDVSAIDALAESALAVTDGVDVYLVDEIGKMECLSATFVAAMRRLMGSRKPVVATIGLDGSGFIAEVKQRKDAKLWSLARGSRDETPARVLAWIQGRVSSPQTA